MYSADMGQIAKPKPYLWRITGYMVPLCCLFVTGGIQAAGEEEALSLEEVLRQTLRQSPQIEIQREVTRIQQGVLQEQSGAFDSSLTLSTSGSEEKTPLTAAQQTVLPYDESDVSTYAYGATVSKPLRAGPTVALQGTQTRTDDLKAKTDAENNGAINFMVTLPLLQGRGAEAAAAGERAAGYDFKAARFDLCQQAANSLLTAANAYWDMLAAQEQLAMMEKNEETTRRMVEDHQRLVDADSAPAADMDLLKANNYDAHSTRLAYAQQWESARQRLASAIGLPSERLTKLRKLAGTFPDIHQEAGITNEVVIDRLCSQALQSRPDILAARLRSGSALVREVGARNGRLPRADLKLTAGYNSLSENDRGSAYSSLMGGELAGANISARLSFSFPFANNAARGRWLQSTAARSQADLQVLEAEREMALSVTAGWRSLLMSREGALASERSTDSYGRAFESELKLMKVGQATVSDVVVQENNARTARLNHIANLTTYAKNIANLLYQSGTLFQGTPEDMRVSAGDLLHPVAPQPGENYGRHVP